MTAAEMIMHHVGASGPVSFHSILEYLKLQHDPKSQDYIVADVMNVLLRNGSIELYDTGDCFVIGPYANR